MSIFKDIMMVVRHTYHVNYILDDDKYFSHRLEGEIMRNVHSIEKGLSLEQPRKLFGLKKIKTMLDYVDLYVKRPDANESIIQMVFDSLYAYLNFHGDEAYSELDLIREKVSEISLSHNTQGINLGGAAHLFTV